MRLTDLEKGNLIKYDLENLDKLIKNLILINKNTNEIKAGALKGIKKMFPFTIFVFKKNEDEINPITIPKVELDFSRFKSKEVRNGIQDIRSEILDSLVDKLINMKVNTKKLFDEI